MTNTVCPACGVAVEDYRRVGPITVVLEPCGHAVDDELFADLGLDGE